MLLSVVIPECHEEGGLPRSLQVLRETPATIDCEQAPVFVNDGSKDNSLQILASAAAQDAGVRVPGFSRNFGHRAAIAAGPERIGEEARQRPLYGATDTFDVAADGRDAAQAMVLTSWRRASPLSPGDSPATHQEMP